MAQIKLAVRGGTIGIISAYAPHNLKPLAERADFYFQLESTFRKCSANLGVYIFGDFNARIGRTRAEEEPVFGPEWFGKEAAHEVDVPNRDLLYEFAAGLELVVANTYADAPDNRRATYKAPGTMQETGAHGYSMLDLLLCDFGKLEVISGLGSVCNAAL